MKLNHITNVDRNVQDKMRYFADYFSFVNEYLGKLPCIPFDNPLSLIDKTIFQIENNFARCKDYVINYLSELFLFYDKSIEVENLLLVKIEEQFEALKNCNDKTQWIKSNTTFINDLKEIKLVYEQNLFDINFFALRDFMKCRHNLNRHKKQIQYATRILVSLFRLNGHPKESLDTYISRIISNDIYKFPFPPDILAVRHKEEYIETTKQFIKNRGFDNQFEGLRNLFIADKYKITQFFFVIDNCVIDDRIKAGFKVRFDRVTFISSEHPDLVLLKKSILDDDKEHGGLKYQDFFGEDKMLAYITMGYEDKASKKKEGLVIVADELLQLNQYCQGNLQVNNLHYFIYDSFDAEQWHATNSLSKIDQTRISQYDWEEIKDNPYESLRNIHSSAKDIILECEKVFLKAFARNEVEYYWIFIENLFAPIMNNAKEIRRDFKKILIKLNNELKDNFLFNISLLLTPYSFKHEEEGLTDEDVFNIHVEIVKKKNFNFDINRYSEKFRSPVLKELCMMHSEFLNTEEIQKWESHYAGLLLDLFAYRNSLVHSGSINKYSRIKLLSVLPTLVSRTRWLIIRTCKTNPELSHLELMKSLTK